MNTKARVTAGLIGLLATLLLAACGGTTPPGGGGGASGSTSIVLDDEGGLWAWGSNNRYLLGDGTTVNSDEPTKVDGPPAVASFSMSETMVFAITEAEGLWAWGLNEFGGLGTGDTATRTTPVRIEALDEYEIVDVKPGFGHGVALLTGGTLIGWGLNNRGQAGQDPGTLQILEPQAIAGISGVTSLSSASETVFAVSGGVPYSIGRNLYGARGVGQGHPNDGVPAAIALTNVLSVAVSASGHTSSGSSVGGTLTSVLAIHADGAVSGWGYNAFGQIHGPAPTSVYTPITVPLP